VKRWNFRKDNWKRFCLFTDESVERLPPPDTSNIEGAYQDFCESLLFAAKQCIPRGRRKNYVPCWDKECETLCRSFTRVPVGTDEIVGTKRLRQKKQERWEEVVNSIDFSHSNPRRGEPSSTNLLAGLDAARFRFFISISMCSGLRELREFLRVRASEQCLVLQLDFNLNQDCSRVRTAFPHLFS